MTVDRDRIFEQLDPPPGGIERFRTRLRAASSDAGGRPDSKRPFLTSRAPIPSWATAAGAAVAVALVLAVVTRLPLDTAERRTPDSGTATTGSTTQIDTPSAPSPAGTLADAPELDWLLGRSTPYAEVRVTVDGKATDVVRLPTSDPRIRVYVVANAATN